MSDDKKKASGSVEEDVLSSALVQSLEVDLSAVVGSRSMTIKQLGKLKPGAVVQFDRVPKGSLVDLYANNRLCAKAELVSTDEGLGVKILEIVNEH